MKYHHNKQNIICIIPRNSCLYVLSINTCLFYEKTTKPIEAHRSNSFKVGEKQHEK